MPFRLSLLLALFAVIACVSPEEAKEREVARDQADQAQCIRQGYKSSSEAFAKCRLQTRDQRLQERIDQTSFTFNPYSGTPTRTISGIRQGAGSPDGNMLH